MFMRPVFAAAKAPRRGAARVVYAEGEDERVLRAVQVVLDEGLARPILVGRPAVIAHAHRARRAAPAGRAATSRSSTPRTTRASATTGRPTTG